MGFEIDGTKDVFSDNKSALLNSSFTESTLKNRHNFITYVSYDASPNEVLMCFEAGKDDL